MTDEQFYALINALDKNDDDKIEFTGWFGSHFTQYKLIKLYIFY